MLTIDGSKAGGGGAGLSGSVGLGMSSCEAACVLVAQTAGDRNEQQTITSHVAALDA